MARNRSAEPVATDRVVVITGSVGAGHDGAARELAARLRDADVSVDVHDYLGALPRLIRLVLRRGYTASIRYRPGVLAWAFDCAEHAPWMAAVIGWMCWVARRRVRRWTDGAAVVVSTFPFASQTMGQLRAAGELRVPLVTYLTDPAPHRLWIHPEIDHHLTVTAATAAAGLRDYRTAMRPVGGLVSTGFADRRDTERRAAVRASLGLPATGPVVLVMAGSEGMGDIPGTVETLARADIADVIVLCGRNRWLLRRLTGTPRVVPLGWRTDVPDLMAASDVLVHNAGGLSLTEALTAGLPAITFKPIPGHGIANARVLEESGLVPWPKNDAELAGEILRRCSAGRAAAQAAPADQDACGFVRSLLLAAMPGPLGQHVVRRWPPRVRVARTAARR